MPRAPRASSAKDWCFTVNNPDDTPEEFLELFAVPGVKYLVFQKEKGDSGTPHYQGTE